MIALQEGSYNRARYYDPSTGRFLNEDPLGINGDDLNFYRYVSACGSKHGYKFARCRASRDPASPAFMESGLDLKYSGLVYGPPRPKPYRLVLGPFESDSGVLLTPHGYRYRLEHPEEE